LGANTFQKTKVRITQQTLPQFEELPVSEDTQVLGSVRRVLRQYGAVSGCPRRTAGLVLGWICWSCCPAGSARALDWMCCTLRSSGGKKLKGYVPQILCVCEWKRSMCFCPVLVGMRRWRCFVVLALIWNLVILAAFCLVL